ncbi:MAG: DUF3486 family protein [Xanthomonadales bacterium]|nr:DUF3486 family protein [Xanthomonadales bacterium]
MGRVSSIRRMPVEVQQLIDQLIRQGRTIIEITEHLQGLNEDVSKSAVGRYVKNAREQMADYRAAQELASQWTHAANENPRGDVSTMVTEMLKMVALRVTQQIQPDDKGNLQLKPMDMMLLSKAVESLEATTRKSMERREKVRQMAMAEAAKAVQTEGRKAGLSADAIERMTKAIGLL